MLDVRPDFPAKTVQEFVALVKSNPGKMNYASAGNGSTPHFSGELFKSRTGIDTQAAALGAVRRTNQFSVIIFSCSLRIPSVSASGRGGQPGT